MTLPRPRALLPVVALGLLAAAAPRAAEPAPPGAPRPRADEGRGPAPPAEPPAVPDTWVDVGHSFVERYVFTPVTWFDRFFSDERELEPDRPRSFLRWRNEVFLREREPRPAFTTSVRATLRLPALNRQLRRLRIVIAGQTRDTVEALSPTEPAPPSAEPAAGDEAVGEGDAGLRFYLWDSFLSHASLGGGVLLGLPPGYYGRIRFRGAVPVGGLFLARGAVVGFWRTDVGFGSSLSLELERPVVRMIFARLSGGGTVTEESPGVEWTSELALLAQLSPRSGAQLGFAATGATDAEAIAPDPATGLPRAWPVPVLGRTRVYARYRRDVFRRWLFAEVEPEVAWPWTPELGRHSAWGIALRLEVQFHGRDPPPPPPPPEPPEPADPPDPEDPPS